MLYLYNSLTQTKEKFIPHDKKKVKMYVCGITPYDTTHLGHAFTYVWFDVLVRYLTFKGYKVTYTQNVTDIDDDILKRAKEKNKDWRELGNFWTKRFLLDMKALNVLPPTYYTKATDAIASIIRIVEVLLKKGYGYARDGNVYYDILRFKDYGKLSRFRNYQMLILLRERGGNPEDSLKKHPLDFILWQKSKSGEPSWESPWGKGRPGWHIECSSMIKNCLGDQIDIHGGGRDLIFPHHESEIAQSESFTGKQPFVKFWVHTAMVLYQGEKMSKSLGNLVMVSDLSKNYIHNEIRWILLSHHYRKPWEFEEKELEEIKEEFSTVLNVIGSQKETAKIDKGYMEKFSTFMDDDLNTPQTLTFIVDLAKRIVKKNEDKTNLASTLLKCLLILGFKF